MIGNRRCGSQSHVFRKVECNSSGLIWDINIIETIPTLSKCLHSLTVSFDYYTWHIVISTFESFTYITGLRRYVMIHDYENSTANSGFPYKFLIRMWITTIYIYGVLWPQVSFGVALPIHQPYWYVDICQEFYAMEEHVYQNDTIKLCNQKMS